MAVVRHFRNEKRTPAFYVMVTLALFVVLCLIGMWMLSSPSSEEAVPKGESIPLPEKDGIKDAKEGQTQQFEESAEETEQDVKESKSEDSMEEGSDRADDKKEAEQEDSKDEESEPDIKTEDLTPDSQQESSEPVEKKDEESDADMKTEEFTPDSQESSEAAEKKDEHENEVEQSGQGHERIEQDKETTTQELEATGKDAKESTSDKQKASEFEESGGVQSEIQIESKEAPNSEWETQASESEEEKEKVKVDEPSHDTSDGPLEMPKNEDDKTENLGSEQKNIEWRLCDIEGAADYIPCLDNKEAILSLPNRQHFQHRERHCPKPPPTCLVPLPKDYHSPVPWPKSRDQVWFSNVPHPGLVSYKKDQNWVKKVGDKLIFPGGGTQFKGGALHYIDYLEKTLPDIAWGRHTRVILDVGCGVASFGGYILDKDVLTMSFAPKDEHEAQIQLALERGIPAVSAVMGTQRLVFPSNVFDAIHCARCRVPWHMEGGNLLLELNRVLRPGGYFIWSATPVYLKRAEDKTTWKEMLALTAAMCWDLAAKTTDDSAGIGVAVFHKPTTNFCYENRKEVSPPLCDKDDKPDAAWYIPMNSCIHKLPTEDGARGMEWPAEWPLRLSTAPTWLASEKGVYGKPAAADFRSDTEHWQHVVDKSYLPGLGIDWSKIRNVMDMKAVYGGFGAALASQPVWVMNVVPFDAADTLPIIFDRGLFGIYHDWCESFSSYPRTYDLLHSDHLFDKLKKRCTIEAVVVEIDRLLRPEGWFIVRERLDDMNELKVLLNSLKWEVKMTYTQGEEGLMAVQKTRWRPEATL